MAGNPQSAKRARPNLESTFDVLVGAGDQQKRYTVHHDVFTQRSECFRAARSAAWNKDPLKPTDLDDEDPEVFEGYMHCVYFGEATPLTSGEDLSKTNRTDHFAALIRLYVLADKMQDIATADLAVDSIYAFFRKIGVAPEPVQIDIAYRSTVEGSTLRAMLRDLIIHEVFDHSYFDNEEPSEIHSDFCQDIAAEYLRIKLEVRSPKYCTADKRFDMYLYEKGKCHYHQHDDKHPKCPIEAPEESDSE